MKKNNKKLGFALIEVLIACSIISLTMIVLMQAAAKGIELSNRSLKQVQVNSLLEEGAEAVKSIRDTNWTMISNFSLETNHYLAYDSNLNQWTLGVSPIEIVDGFFTRTIIFSPVYRDVNDNISDFGTLDSGIKKVNITITWPGSTVNSKTLIIYLANILN